MVLHKTMIEMNIWVWYLSMHIQFSISKKFLSKQKKDKRKKELLNCLILGENINGKVIDKFILGRWSEYSDVWSEALR